MDRPVGCWLQFSGGLIGRLVEWVVCRCLSEWFVDGTVSSVVNGWANILLIGQFITRLCACFSVGLVGESLGHLLAILLDVLQNRRKRNIAPASPTLGYSWLAIYIPHLVNSCFLNPLFQHALVYAHVLLKYHSVRLCAMTLLIVGVCVCVCVCV